MEHDECAAIRETLPEYVEGGLDTCAAEKVEKHFAKCWDCRHEAEMLGMAWEALDTWKSTEPSVLFRARFWNKVENASYEAEEEEQSQPAGAARAAPRAKPKATGKATPAPFLQILAGWLKSFTHISYRPPAWAPVAVVVLIVIIWGVTGSLRPPGLDTPRSTATVAGTGAPTSQSEVGVVDPDEQLTMDIETYGARSVRALPEYVAPRQETTYVELDYPKSRLMDSTHDVLNEML